jgi:hypothetical protein
MELDALQQLFIASTTETLISKLRSRPITPIVVRDAVIVAKADYLFALDSGVAGAIAKVEWANSLLAMPDEALMDEVLRLA